jgi:uncharacterized protein (TIRG00374 family)
MKKRFVISAVISLLFLWLAIRKVNFQEFKESLAAIQMGYLIPAFLITLVVCLFRSFRWRLLFSRTKSIEIGSLFSVIMVGFLANNLLPARMGEVVMAYLVGKKEGISKSLALGTIFLDRLLDVITLLLFLSGSILFLFNPLPVWVVRIEQVGVTLLIFSALLVWVSIAKKETSTRTLRFFLTPLPSSLRERILQIYVQFVDGLVVLKHRSVLIKALAVSTMVWLGLASGVYLIFLSFDLSSLSLSSAVVVLAIVNLGLIIPSAPGFVGTFQFFCVAALALFQVEGSKALSFAVIYHLSQFLPTTLVGLYFLNKENLSLGRIAVVKEA